jgi:hypothetical protein
LTTVLGDAIPRYIQVNPAQRRRGKGPQGAAAHPAHRTSRESLGNAHPGAPGRRAMRRPIRP